jgi:hypothetical protein
MRANKKEVGVTLSGRLPPWAVLGIIFVIGLILIIVPAVRAWTWDYGIIRDIGVALLTTAVLGFTVDRWLKLEIAVDVFKAALGYVLPDEFREEVRRISNYKMLADKHALIIDVTRLDLDTVRATVMLERTVRNISSETQVYANRLDIDEWNFTNAKSHILE